MDYNRKAVETEKNAKSILGGEGDGAEWIGVSDESSSDAANRCNPAVKKLI